jgi:hypothetical protein
LLKFRVRVAVRGFDSELLEPSLKANAVPVSARAQASGAPERFWGSHPSAPCVQAAAAASMMSATGPGFDT